jgi:hypothetical protein
MASSNLGQKGASQTIEITLAHSVTHGSLDDNYELYKRMKDVDINPAEAKKVLRKVDTRILSLLMVTYVLQYLDKNCINLASVYGLKTDTHLEGQDYSWLSKSLILVNSL